MADQFLLSAQFALFLKNTLARPDQLAYQLYGEIESFKNIIPEISSFSQPGTPSVFISNPNDNCNMAITNKRIDLYYQNSLKGIEPTFFTFKKNARTIIQKMNLECVRIGIITAILYPDVSANEFLSKKIKIDDVLDIQLTYNKRFKFNGIEFNKVSKFYPGRINIVNAVYTGLVIERDVNNVPTERILSTEDIEQAFDKFFNPEAGYED